MGDVAKGLCLMRSAGSWASISVGGLVLRRGSVVVLKIDGVCISNRRKKEEALVSLEQSMLTCLASRTRNWGKRKKKKDDVNWRRRRRRSVKKRVRVGKLPKVQKRKNAGSAVERAREEKGKGEEKMR